MTTEAQVLAFCRAGLDNESIIAILSAITSRMNPDNPACNALDKCNDALMDIQEAARNEELWSADDAECRRGNAAGSIPSFLTREAA